MGGTLVSPGWWDVGGIGAEVTLGALSWKGRWWPQGGKHWGHWVGNDVGGIGVEGTLVALGLK